MNRDKVERIARTLGLILDKEEATGEEACSAMTTAFRVAIKNQPTQLAREAMRIQIIQGLDEDVARGPLQ